VAQFNHPHILSLYDSGEVQGFLFYVMPFVEGESLRDRLDRGGQLPIGDVIRIVHEVADALAYSHARGVVHRDIKPGNVLLSGRHAVVTDFGVAKAVSASGTDKATTTGMAVGTPQYMAPEQAMGEADVDARADLYALGLLAYEMLAGRPTYHAPGIPAAIARPSGGGREIQSGWLERDVRARRIVASEQSQPADSHLAPSQSPPVDASRIVPSHGA
jgi:eukaryotic-like serine/threonine-protein kinase